MVTAFKDFRTELASLDADLNARFQAGEPASDLVRARAHAIDPLLRALWSATLGETDEEVALIAVGGYGRGELHPCSDIDLMVLFADSVDPTRHAAALERFIAGLWDIGLEAGHSVRRVADCVIAATADITIATNLMEARLLAGPGRLFDRMREATGPDRIWPGPDFFEAKRREQQNRHARFHDTAYKLEPDVKESPGGLRDIQMIGWVAKRHFGVETLAELVDHGFLTVEEHEALTAGQDFLWQVRWGLHHVNGRREDRLLFDAQLKLAALFGYEDSAYALGVEQFMQRYYRAILDLSRLNDMLLQYFQEAILHAGGDPEPAPINPRFEEVNGFIQVTHDRVFLDEPSALLEIFHLLQQNPHLKGVRAATLRLLLAARHQVDDAFRADLKNQSLFLSILREPVGITHELRRMNRYGILGRYIPVFGRVAGRMQYDLFHAYTVDEHTLFVVGNLRRFALPRFNHELPIASEVMQSLTKPELAYLAGLFHDIAKGRGGDHSELGAVDAETFCNAHGLSRYDARLVSWLVQHHLALSLTAQKQDIADPRVIHEFARKVGDQTHLDHLFVLTCADVRGTNPDLWNSWKGSLFTDLYRQTRRALRRGLEHPIDMEELIAEKRAAALKILFEAGMASGPIEQLWSEFTDEYFLLHTPDEIAWHTTALAGSTDPEAALVLVRQTTERGSTAIFLYARDDPTAFSRTTAALDRLGLTVVDARIIPARNGRSLATYLVLEATGEPIADRHRMWEIHDRLHRAMSRDGDIPVTTLRSAPRKVRAFRTPTLVSFSDDRHNRRTAVEIITGDRPGLLAEIGRVFAEQGIRVQNAKITTVGERVEDVFFIPETVQREKLEAALLETLAT